MNEIVTIVYTSSGVRGISKGRPQVARITLLLTAEHLCPTLFSSFIYDSTARRSRNRVFDDELLLKSQGLYEKLGFCSGVIYIKEKSMQQVNTTFTVKSWDEQPYRELADSSKFTKVESIFTFEGAFEGESAEDYLMFYRADGDGNYVGLARIEGSLKGQQGSFVVQHSGTFDATGVTVSWFVVPGSGTGELKGLKGESHYRLAGHGPYPIVFEYELG
jgi:hypothetical protein